MSLQAQFTLVGRNPDVLSCIANLSNDEVFTPPDLANRMLDQVAEAWASDHDGANIWANKEVRFLDPCTKTGVFLREITRRLTEGLEKEIPELQSRVDHILKNQVFGIAITKITSLMARRSVYCSKYANGPHSIARSLPKEDGNIWFGRVEHTWKNGKCTFCGASQEIQDRGDQLEAHAYALIHTKDVKSRIREIFGKKMQFDVIIGNPPYQLGDGGGGGGASATPVYNLFVQAAVSLEPRYICMITPSRWFSGGKGLDEFRDQMLNGSHLMKLVDFPQLYDVFPGVKIRGGVSYWLWAREHSGGCEVTTMVGNEVISAPVVRKLDAYDVLVRSNEGVRILERVESFQLNGKREAKLSEQVSPRRPFGLTNERGKDSPDGIANPVLVYGNQQTSYLPLDVISSNREWINKWKVLLVKAHGTSGKEDVTILGEPILAGPGTACTETYLVAGVFDDENEAQYFAAYMKTRFVRFLVSLRKITQNITRESYKFVPVLPMDRVWTDELLFSRYGVLEDEVRFICSRISNRQSNMTKASESPEQ